MKRTLAIFYKEMRRFFTDYRMLAAIFLPGILIFVLYSVMGNFITQDNIVRIEPTYSFKVAISDNYSTTDEAPCSFALGLDAVLENEGRAKATYYYYDIMAYDRYRHELIDGDIDLIILFDEGFEDKINQGLNETKPNFECFYNSDHLSSEFIYQYVASVASMVYSTYTMNADPSIQTNFGSSSSYMNQVMSSILPMIAVTLLFSSCLSFAPESIAGEKERGTLNCILITPIKKHEFVLGKVGALLIVSLISGLMSCLGVLTGLPSMMGSGDLGISLGVSQYVTIAIAMISTTVLLISAATLISTLSKSIKEATAYLGPLMMVLMLLSLLPGILASDALYLSFIPVVNTSAMMASIVQGSLDVTFSIITIVVNLVFTALFIYLSSLAFKNERIMNRS